MTACEVVNPDDTTNVAKLVASMIIGQCVIEVERCLA